MTIKKRATWHKRHDLPWLLVFVLPAFLIVVAVQFYPLAYSALLSVQEWSLTESQAPQGFVGWDNFARELGDSTFQRSVRNSIVITGGAVILEMFLGVCLAYLTMGSSWRMRAVRTLLILPMVIAPVAAGTLWRILLNSRAGLVNHLLGFIGIKGPEWLASPDWAVVAVILLDTWQWTPFVLLVAGAAIASIPEDLLEVAAIDGASRWQVFLYVELPLLMPLLLLTLVFRTLESLLSLDSIYSLTFGGPGFSTYTMTFYIYTQGLRNFNFGAAAASSWMFMVFASICIWLVFWFQRRER